MTVFVKGMVPGLYAITDSTLLPGDSVVSAVAAAIRGGATLVQYRDKINSGSEQRRLAMELQKICQAAGVPLIINDSPQLALECQASGVHLGLTDDNLNEARTRLGQSALIGATCHGKLELASTAVAAGADYVAFGRFFQSATKPGAPPAAISVLTNAKSLNVPVVAIGGVTLENGAQLIKAGADFLAVVGGLFEADDIEHQARSFTELFHRCHPYFQTPAS
ncbi:thiamine phosphate synthase [Marinobacter changyiensis]|uniref:thiamine phosphate synthase n=1 Tax=Marinobacter changyiensis TaxID=2604091 RepID=UPI0012657156|nr:thiamine phosphate synthase [Marinobacter changyiensis]